MSAADPRLDRLVQFDARSRAFPIRALLAPTARPVSCTWRCPIYLNQGDEGACCGFAVAHEAAAPPAPVSGITEDVARGVYYRARVLDDWPGEDYEGTSVLAAVKAGMERKWYAEYRWAFSLDDLILALGWRGPAVLGLNWYEGMMEADRLGYIHPTGTLVGGHAIMANGVSLKNRDIRLHNSWGPEFGLMGDAFISFEDLDRLLHEQGEACVPTWRMLG